MPQDPYGLGIKPLGIDPDNLGIKPLIPPQTQEPQSWTDWGIETGLRTVPALAGGFFGSALGPLGTVAGSAIGSGLGETAAELYSGKPLNPTQIAVQTGIGAIPPFFGAPAKGASIAALRAYARQAPLKGALEGAVINAGATVPTQLAETGELPSWGQVAGGGAGGALFGLAGGAALGSTSALRQANRFQQIADAPKPPPVIPPPSVPPVTMDPRPPGLVQNKLDFGQTEPQQLPLYREPLPDLPQPIEGPEVGPYGTGIDQPRLPLDDEFGQQELGLPLTRTPEPEYHKYGGPEEVSADEIRDWPSGASEVEVQLLKQQGWEPYGINPETNRTQMIRRGAAPSTPEIPSIPKPVTPSPTMGAEGTFHSDEGFVFPKEQLTDAKVKSLTAQGYELVDKDAQGNGIFRPIESQEMRVPGLREGSSGMENVALGGADARVWDVMGSSLYARKRPVTTVKELLQNAWDEHKEIGSKESVRVLIDNDAPNPRGGDNGKSITVRDRGRGLSPESIYTYLTNLGATGKAGVQSAAGGFGFAKAAPFTGGKHVTVRSVIDTPDGRMMYSFEGNPAELKNQARGVPLNAVEIGPKIPTGLEVTTFYDKNIPGFYDTTNWAQNMAERSPSVETPTKIASTYGANPVEARRWLDETPANPIHPTKEYNYIAQHQAKDYSPKPIPTLMDTIKTPGADVNIHYDIEPGTEAAEASLHLTNKGMYQGSNRFGYGQETPNVPRSIVADIIATVEEGHEAYPFSANREQINDDVSNAIDKWIKDNIITGVTQKRVAEIQRQYDAIAPIHTGTFRPTKMDYLDEGNLLTSEELNKIVNHPRMITGLRVLERIHGEMLKIADTLGWTPESYGATWNKPSDRLKKFGLLFKAPDSNGTVMGIHIPRPDDMNNSAILFNLMEHLNSAEKNATPIDKLLAETIVTLAHEQAHIPGGGHDKGHSYRDADLRTAFGAENTVNWFMELDGAFSDGKGRISPEISELLQIYNESRTRATGGTDALLATGISSQRFPNTGGTAPGNIKGTSTGKTQFGTVGKEKKKPSVLQEAYNASRAITTTLDLSAPMRQGLPLIASKEWWTSWKQQMSALGSEAGYQKTLADLKARPMFQSSVDFKTGKVKKSFAEQAGIKLMDLINKREESVASKWLENIPGVRASNRAYTAFLNQLRADTFETLLKSAKADFDAKIQGSRNPYTDLPFAKELADFVNTATGRGPMRIAHPTIEGGRIRLKESSLEQYSKGLTNVLFSPRLFFAHVRMLNPATYAMASPFVRKQHLKALLSTAGAWSTVSGLAYMAGQTGLGDVSVSMDTNDADFGKIRIGNTRIDPAGGFQQYIVAASRLLTGKVTSSRTQTETELGAGFRAETRKDVAERFAVNKLHPMIKFGYDMLFASQYQPFHTMDRTAQLFVPLIIQDAMELAKEDITLLPWLGPVAIGMGTQTYGKGESVGRIFPKENDILFEGGPISNLWEEAPRRPTY